MQLVQFYPTGGKAIVNGYPAFNYYDNPTINYWDMTYGPTGLLSLNCVKLGCVFCYLRKLYNAQHTGRL